MDQENGKLAREIFDRNLYKFGKEMVSDLSHCHHPCKFVDSRYDITDSRFNPKRLANGNQATTLTIGLKPYVQVSVVKWADIFVTKSWIYFSFISIFQETVANYTYSFLSLVAEFGGYVGLFLGMSVNQIADIVNALVKKMFT